MHSCARCTTNCAATRASRCSSSSSSVRSPRCAPKRWASGNCTTILRSLALDPATLGRDEEQGGDRLVILRHTLMNPYLIDRENGISYIDMYFEHLARRIRALQAHG